MRTKHNWPQLIEDWKSSSQNKHSFCKERGICYQSFLHQFKATNQVQSGQGFQQVFLNSTDRIDFHFTDGRCISFPITTPKDIVRFLVSL